ncbi:MAG: glycosyltransferase family 9 protein, partial [Desulfonatronovibrionaceae bacterium]
LAGLFDPARVRGYISSSQQQLRHPWTRLFFRLAAHRRLSPLNLMDFWGLYAPFPLPPEKVNPEPGAEGSGLGVVLAGRDMRRSIPMAALVPLVRAVRSRLNSSGIFLLGSAAEKSLAREFKSMAPDSVLNEIHDYTGRTGLQDLPDLVSSLEMVLCPDTGLMHLAAHVGTRVTAFFFSSALCFETGPYGRGHLVYQMLPPCAPCREAKKCNFELACHKMLADAEILKSVCRKASLRNLEALLCKSDLDDLGVNFFPLQGRDPWQDQRKALRELLRLSAGLAPGDAEITPEAAAMFYHESQWMLGY